MFYFTSIQAVVEGLGEVWPSRQWRSSLQPAKPGGVQVGPMGITGSERGSEIFLDEVMAEKIKQRRDN